MIINNTRNVSSLNQKWLLISRTLVEISVLMDWTKRGKIMERRNIGKAGGEKGCRKEKNKGMDETRDTVRRREKKEDGKKW